MEKIKISVFKTESKPKYKGSTPVKLNNGDLFIIEWDDPKYYLISTYGDNKVQYCSLIDLRTGARAFAEPCSRSTTLERLLSHLGLNYPSAYNLSRQYKAGEYAMNIELIGEGNIPNS